jgi:hypothetical protein
MPRQGLIVESRTISWENTASCMGMGPRRYLARWVPIFLIFVVPRGRRAEGLGMVRQSHSTMPICAEC